MASTVQDLRSAIESEAAACGFADVGFASPDIGKAGARLRSWLADGHHGEMGWMAERISWRADPAVLWPDARSVIMLAWPYDPGPDPLAGLTMPDRGVLSVYSEGRDYHDVVKKRLKRLGRWLIEHAGGEIKVFVDTAPVMEKPLAAMAGIGWQGKHTNLVSRRLGSWFFLGAIFTTLKLGPPAPHEDRCGNCRRCLDICPTAAFSAPYQLNARRCISYLTIEHKAAIPRALRPAIGNRIYGCDDCLAVCPWNKFAEAAHVTKHEVEEEAPLLADLATLEDGAFREKFRGTAIRRIGRARFVRNVLIAIGNSGQSGLADIALRLTRDGDPLVRGAAVWALSRLTTLDDFRLAMNADPDAEVEEEWRLGARELSSRAQHPSSEG